MLDFNANQINAAAAGQIRFCPSCGGRNDADAKFCEVCGSKLPEMKAPVSSPFTPAEEKTESAAPVFEQAAAPTEPTVEVTQAPVFAPEPAAPVQPEKVTEAPVFESLSEAVTEETTQTSVFETVTEEAAPEPAAPIFEQVTAPEPAAPVFAAAPAPAPEAASAAPVFEAAPAPAASKAAAQNAALEKEEQKYAMALGLPEWTIEPPSMMVRRK